MSGSIKPEDIGESFIESVEDECKHVRDKWHWLREPELISAILNAAIEAGLVSPPCHVTRYLGELICQGGTMNPEIYPGKPKNDGDEHYRGQKA